MSGNTLKLGAAALAAALAIGGVAWAGQGSSPIPDAGGGLGAAFEQGDEVAASDRRENGLGRRRPGLMRKVARADLVVVIDGEARNIRLDRGVVKSVSEDAITLEELDGTTVTIAIDSETRVRVGREEGSLDAIEQGLLAMTIREDGGAARMVRAFDPDSMPVRSRE